MSISFYEMPPVPSDEARREDAVAVSGALDAVGDASLCALVQEAKAFLRADVALVSIIHGDYQHIIAAVGLPLGITSRRTSFCGHAVASGEDVFCVPDLDADRRFAGNPHVNGDLARYRFYAAAVLHDDTGAALGALCVLADTPRAALGGAERATLVRLGREVVRRLADLRDESAAA